MRLKNSRLSRSRKAWSYPTISLAWLLTAFFLTCHASQYLLLHTMPGMETTWLALSPQGIWQGYFWQFVTHPLASGSIWQLLPSAAAFFIAGNELESIAGPRHLAGAFLFTLLPSAAASLLWPPAGGQMGIWPGVCGVLAVLGTMLPLLEMRYRFFSRSIVVRMRAIACVLPAFLTVAILANWVTHTSLLTLPPALLSGYLYARWMGYGVPTRLERIIYERRLHQQRLDRLTPRELIEQEIDPILEKIARDGWKSVTRSEKKLLERSAASLRQS